MKKKKVLFLIWSFTAGGGAEKILANVVNNLDYNRYDVSVLEYINFNVKKEITNDEVKILQPILYNGGSLLNRIKNKIIKYLTFKNHKLLYKWFVKEEYDIEVAFNYMIPSFLVSNSKNKKYVWVHSSIEDLDYNNVNCSNYKNTKLKYKLQRESFKKMNNIIAISNRTHESIVKLYPETKDIIKKIYNGYDFETLYTQSKVEVESIKEDKKYTLIAIGRLVEQKNFLFLIDVAKKLKDIGIEYNLFILGNGYEHKKILEKIVVNGLHNNVHLLGFVSNPYPYLKQADLFCLTSIAEGFPTVLVESLALGCPFVSTNVSGTEELSDGGKCGIVVDDFEHYVLAIRRILEDDELRKAMSKNGIEKIKDYSIANQIKAIDKIFNLD